MLYLCTCGHRIPKPGKCKACSRAKERRRGSAHQRGYGKAWQQLAARAIHAQPWCSVQDCNDTDLTVDHIDPSSKHRHDLTLADVQVLCRSHNSSKGGGGSKLERGGLRPPRTFSRERAVTVRDFVA